MPGDLALVFAHLNPLSLSSLSTGTSSLRSGRRRRVNKYFTKPNWPFNVSLRTDFRYLGFGVQIWRYNNDWDGLVWGIELNLLGVTITLQDNLGNE